MHHPYVRAQKTRPYVRVVCTGLQSDHINITWNGHCACAVSRDLSRGGGKNDPHFWNPCTQFTYSLCHFQGATMKIKLLNICEKWRLSHCECYKVHCACAVSRDLCIGVPQNHTQQFFEPELSIHYTTFMGLRWRLRIVYIGASPC